MANPTYKQVVTSLFSWLTKSDNVKSDQTSTIIPARSISSHIISHQDCVIAGLKELSSLLLPYHPYLTFNALVKDGNLVKSGQTIANLNGNAKIILSYERTILNFLQRMSGIATQTNHIIKYLNNLQPTTYNLQPMIAATRKTPWGLLDKKAVAVGGGLTHRLSLADGMLIKDNHLAILKKEYSLKSEAKAVTKALELSLSKVKNTMVEIEVTTPEAVEAAVKASSGFPLTIMLDNWQANEAKKTITRLKKKYDLSHVLFEASGGIDEANIKDWAKAGVNFISLGSLTHSPKAADLSLEIE